MMDIQLRSNHNPLRDLLQLLKSILPCQFQLPQGSQQSELRAIFLFSPLGEYEEMLFAAPTCLVTSHRRNDLCKRAN